MALDATAGTAASNSYLTVAAADAFAAADVGPSVDTWKTLDDSSKERMLQRATREIDAYVRTSGTPYLQTQALLYPRAIDSSSGAPYIPVPIQRATWAQAKYLAQNIRVLEAADTRRARGMQSASEPNVSYTQDDAGASLLSAEARGHLQGMYGAGATIKSVKIGTDYSYPNYGDPGMDLLP